MTSSSEDLRAEVRMGITTVKIRAVGNKAKDYLGAPEGLDRWFKGNGKNFENSC